MEIKASDIKALRDTTGAGLMDCKKALTECNGDVAAAEKYLREKGLAAMAKRSDRATAEGRIFVKQDGNKVAMVEVVCETDFVAKNDDFIALGNKLTELTLAKGLTEVTEEHTALLNELAIKIRENMSVRRLAYIEVPAGCVVSTYVHHNFKIGSLVVIKGSEDEKIKDFAHVCCLHLASKTPSYITKDEVPQSYIDEQKEIFRAQMDQDEKMASKPDNVKEGILQGKINKHLAEICFMDQMYLDDEKKSVTAVLSEMGKSVGAELSFEKVVLFLLGK